MVTGPWLSQTPSTVHSATVLFPLCVLHRQPLVGELWPTVCFDLSLFTLFFEGPRVSCA